MATDPRTINDPKLVRTLLENARRAGRSDLVLACQTRLAELAGQGFDSQLEREFWTAVTVAEELATERNGRTTRLARTRQKEKRVGVVQCLIDWATDPKVTQGFTILVGAGRADLTGEAIVVRHRDKFPAHAVLAAQQKLREYGVAL